jgi:hypothetical protein
MRGHGARWAMACVLVAAAVAPTVASARDDAADLDAAKMFDWQRKAPADFLDVLRRHAKLPDLMGTFAGVDAAHAGWVKEEHLPALVALVSSKERCAHIATPEAKRLPETLSSVGQEALVMIQAFRDGTYPPRGLQTSEGFSSRKAEILAWWKTRP